MAEGVIDFVEGKQDIVGWVPLTEIPNHINSKV